MPFGGRSLKNFVEIISPSLQIREIRENRDPRNINAIQYLPTYHTHFLGRGKDRLYMHAKHTGFHIDLPSDGGL